MQSQNINMQNPVKQAKINIPLRNPKNTFSSEFFFILKILSLFKLPYLLQRY